MNWTEKLALVLGIAPDIIDKHKSRFLESLTHRSATKQQESQDHNERLEFLGDAVLELVTTEFLYKKYKSEAEGILTNYRSALVKRENLARVAREMSLGQFMILSSGEARSGGREKDYLLANLVEAIIGALYLSIGMRGTRTFIERFILVDIETIVSAGAHLEAKSMFQEFTQGEFGITPSYKVLAESGKDHEKAFVIGAYLDNRLVGEGQGASKKEAQSVAARVALQTRADWENYFSPKV